ncbi:MAG TPA: VWA domain-containing protein [Burkholderiales bacterium]|nr:VWA domain-containing protein [Burkholderiales bacterium]
MHTHLFDNIVGFGRLLRSVGLAAGPTQLAQAMQAIALAGLVNREDFYWALASSLVVHPEQKAVFDQAFELFWRAQLRTTAVAELNRWRRDDTAQSETESGPVSLEVLSEALAADEDAGEDASEADQRNSAAEVERLSDKHFDQMSEEELAAAKQHLAQLPFDTNPYLSRRRQRDVNGDAVDWRGSFRAMTRRHGGLPKFSYCLRREEAPALVLLCDISGSMQIYSRVLLHFVCALAQRRKRTFAFLFGTRLTPISRLCGGADLDRAVSRAVAAARDFDGGTRIGGALEAFNKLWSRRVLSRNAVVILLSDGLDADDSNVLDVEIARLHRSCRQLMWLNPLLRFEGFEPKASGVQTILRHVDSLHAVHTLRHIGDVAAALRDGAAKSRAV